ncbi:MAG TPA: hypothetical protein V6D15_09615 [Oculatellaceae cyanobacterium]|jgi:hypothetical protein
MNSKDCETLEQIAQLLALLPSDSLLQKAQTKDQIEEWHKARRTQSLLAEEWRAKLLVKQYHPIEEALDKQEISEQKAQLIILRVDEYEARWELCQVAEKYVADFHQVLQFLTDYADQLPKPVAQLWYKFFHRASLKQYPFQSAYDLFAETLKEDADGSFSTCLESYYEVPIKSWRQATKQYTDLLKQTEPSGIYPKLSTVEELKLKKNLVWSKLVSRFANAIG